jgi:hypothetical protein
MIVSSILTGMLGDLALQLIVKSYPNENKFGLRTYFDQHGSLESIFIAGGMMGALFSLYKQIDPTFDNLGLSLYATGLDILFRNNIQLMPSLKDYYSTLPYYFTIPWAIIPALMVKALATSLQAYG